LLEVLHGYPQVPVDGGVQVVMDDAYGDERRRLVFRLHIPALATLGPAEVAEVVIRYVTVGEQVALHELTAPTVVNAVSADDAAAAVPDAEVTEEVVVLASARAQEQARQTEVTEQDLDAMQTFDAMTAKQMRYETRGRQQGRPRPEPS
jgi:hypothetical protein